MKVHRSNPRRLDWLNVTDEAGNVGVSLLAHRNEIIVDVTVDGRRVEAWTTARKVAEALAKLEDKP